MEEQRKQLILTIGGGLLGLSLLILLGVWLMPEDRFVSSGHSLIVKNRDADSQMVFELGADHQLSVRVLDFQHNKREFRSAGVSAVLHYLKPEAYETFETRYQSVSRCPASFLNWNAGHLLLLMEDAEFAQRLNLASLKQGDSLHLEGAFLEFDHAIIEGQQAHMQEGNVRYFLVRAATINGRKMSGRAALPIGDIEVVVSS